MLRRAPARAPAARPQTLNKSASSRSSIVSWKNTASATSKSWKNVNQIETTRSHTQRKMAMNTSHVFSALQIRCFSLQAKHNQINFGTRHQFNSYRHQNSSKKDETKKFYEKNHYSQKRFYPGDIEGEAKSLDAAPKGTDAKRFTSQTLASTNDFSQMEEKRLSQRKWKLRGLILLLLLTLILFFLWRRGLKRTSQFQTWRFKLQQPNLSEEQAANIIREIYKLMREERHLGDTAAREGFFPEIEPFLFARDANIRTFALLILLHLCEDRQVLALVATKGYLHRIIRYADEPSRTVGLALINNIVSVLPPDEVHAVTNSPGILPFLQAHINDPYPLLKALAQLNLHLCGIQEIPMTENYVEMLRRVFGAFNYWSGRGSGDLYPYVKSMPTLQPDLPWTYYVMGYWFNAHGYSDEAKKAYSQCLRMEPSNLNALYELGLTSLRDNEVSRCAVLWTRILQEDPTFPKLLEWLDNYARTVSSNPRFASSNPSLGTLAQHLVKELSPDMRESLSAQIAPPAPPTPQVTQPQTFVHIVPETHQFNQLSLAQQRELQAQVQQLQQQPSHEQVNPAEQQLTPSPLALSQPHQVSPFAMASQQTQQQSPQLRQ